VYHQILLHIYSYIEKTILKRPKGIVGISSRISNFVAHLLVYGKDLKVSSVYHLESQVLLHIYSYIERPKGVIGII
jgi:hypothetical protein